MLLKHDPQNIQTGRLVKILQESLKALKHYQDAIDESFGPKTKTAVEHFQTSVGLPKTGEVDVATWAILSLSVSSAANTAATDAQTKAGDAQIKATDAQAKATDAQTKAGDAVSSGNNILVGETSAICKEAMVAQGEVQSIVDQINRLTNSAIQVASDAQLKLSTDKAKNAKAASDQAQTIDEQARAELVRAGKLLAFIKSKEADKTDAKLADNRTHAQKALDEIRAMLGKPYPAATVSELNSTEQAYFKREYKPLPALKTDVEGYEKTARDGLDSSLNTASEPENLQPLMNIFFGNDSVNGSGTGSSSESAKSATA